MTISWMWMEWLTPLAIVAIAWLIGLWLRRLILPKLLQWRSRAGGDAADVTVRAIRGPIMLWALMGGTLMGNATLIGSTANIVAAGVLERRGLGEITFAQWLKPGLAVAVPTLLIANLLVLLQLPLMPR